MSDLETLFQLVVIGASAGGIEALSKLVTTLPSSFPVPIVIAQHLDPNRPSHLGEILTRQSSLPVVTVWEHVVLQPGTIYVVPSNRHVQITDHEVAILPGEMGEGRSKPSINLLLSSAAEVYGEKLIAVILTGTGTDGTAGAETVNLLGGTVLIQDPATAAYPGMPRSLASQSVDIVADLDRIGTILVNLVTGIPVATQFHQSSQPVELENELQPFLNQVREHSGLDFRSYKPATILRRLQRRIATTETVNLQGYLKYLEAHPEEYQQLISNFLIKVTEFMRDPELFNYLREHLLPELVTTSQTQGNELRIWSAGCATGEEAYSLAILVGEVLGNQLEHFTIKIFATDLDPDAIAFARRGIYPAIALARLPEKWVTGSFTRHQNGNYEIKKWIRNLLVFGEHDLGQHAPFPRLDLVVCRNVLIYFSKEYQQHILHRFAFALREGGYLVLGRTEAINSLPELFVPPLTTQYPHKIYRRQGSQQLFLPNLGSISGATLLDKDQKVNRARSYRFATRDLFQVQQKVQQARVAREDLLLKLPVGVVVVNQRFDIQEINNAARRLLGIHTPAIGEDLVHLAQRLSPRPLANMIRRTICEQEITTLEEVEVPHLVTGEQTFLQITCYPQVETGEESLTRLALLVITDITPNTLTLRKLEQAQAQQVAQTAELAQMVASLQASNAELQRTNERLEQANAAITKAKSQTEETAVHHSQQMEFLVETNRTLVAGNEELSNANAELRWKTEEFLLRSEEAQAATEEAETLNEEMQATNEELETLNEELQATVEELNTSNADLLARGNELQRLSTSLEAQQKHSEKERAQLEAILTGMADAVLVVNPDGSIRLTNNAYTEMFGKGVEQAANLILEDEKGIPLPPEALPQRRAALAEPFNITFTSRQGEGNRRWYEALGQPVQLEGIFQYEVVVIRDVSERSLRHLQEQFLSITNHELRTPLTVIQGYLQLLNNWCKAHPEGNKIQPYVEHALVQGKRLTRLIDDIRDVSAIQSGKVALQLVPVKLETILAETVELGQGLTTKQTITLEADGSESLVVNGDTARLQQVIFNLLINAIKHAPSSSTIEVKIRQVGDQAEIRVTDNGDGIAPEHLSEIFSRFYQVAHGKPSAGLGLGLYISQQIVSAHGGTITVTSSPGEGSTFVVQLPLLATEQK